MRSCQKMILTSHLTDQDTVTRRGLRSKKAFGAAPAAFEQLGQRIPVRPPERRIRGAFGLVAAGLLGLAAGLRGGLPLLLELPLGALHKLMLFLDRVARGPRAGSRTQAFEEFGHSCE
jgi:hypothetical protein